MRLPTSSTRALLAAFAVLGLASLSSAQTVSVKTNPVGALTYSFKQGTQLVGVSLVKPEVFSGSVSAVNSFTLSVTGGTNVGALLTTGAAYYVEVTSDNVNAGLFNGDRFEVDTALTKSAAAGSVVLKTHAENTVTGTPPTTLVGVSFVVRPHVTLGGLLTDLTGSFVAGDKITIRENGGSSVTATLNAGGTAWIAGITNKNTLVVYPGVGFFLVRAAASTTTASFTGSVRTNSFVQILKVGPQVIAEGYPVDSAPAPTSGPSRLFTNAAGNVFANGDKLTAYNPSSVLTTYTYATATNRWVAGITNGTPLNLFHPTSASFLVAANANANYVQLVPFTL